MTTFITIEYGLTGEIILTVVSLLLCKNEEEIIFEY